MRKDDADSKEKMQMKTKKEKVQLIRTLKALLKEHFGDNIQDVILFGSQAKGTATEFSDYDVLIILKDDYDWKYRDRMTEVVYDMELQYDILFNKHLLSVKEMKQSLKGAEPMYKIAIKHGIYA
ncbi:DNA polymerase subunit beta [Candidatus Magnetomoraceae bacterium gMMP-15]